jgi:cysteate synthase
MARHDLFSSYIEQLPFDKDFEGGGPRICCFHSVELGRSLGLDNLWVLLSGWSPRHGANFRSGTFKELEALGVLARVTSQTEKVLIVSSAGNAGRSFLEAGVMEGDPVIVVVPANALETMYCAPPDSQCPPLLLALKDAHYPDAIRMVRELKTLFLDELVTESGCFNIARRDAIGILMHSACRQMGRVPDHFFQAVGSGTGGIAAWEAVLRIVDELFVGSVPTQLHLVQNAPFAIMADAWNAGKKSIEPLNQRDVRLLLGQTSAKALSNATPPYSVMGGVYDALKATGGGMYSVTNREISLSLVLLEACLGEGAFAEAGAALAGLMQAVAQGKVKSDDHILLHVTGFGLAASVKELSKVPYPNRHLIDQDDTASAAKLVGSYLRNARV